MEIPTNIPGLRWATGLLVAYGAAWIALEGRLWRVVVMGTAVSVISLAHLVDWRFAGRKTSFKVWLLMAGGLGLLAGLGSGVLTFLFMGIKTGLHAHGPEFTPEEIRWVLQQIPWWSATGLLAGLGSGLLLFYRAGN